MLANSKPLSIHPQIETIGIGPMIQVKTCSCGNEAEKRNALCARCAALRELELEPGATPEEIKHSFHTMARVWHPDRFPTHKHIRDKAEERQKSINAAYSYLMRSGPQAKSQPRRKSKPPWVERARARRRIKEAGPVPGPAEPTRNWQDGKKWREILPRRVLIFPTPIVLGIAMIVPMLVAGWLLATPLDRMLMSNPISAHLDLEYKASMQGKFTEMKVRLRDAFAGIFPYEGGRERATQGAVAVPLTARRAARWSATAQPDHVEVNGTPGKQHFVMPFVTAGLTKNEVIAAAGNPTGNSDDTLVYAKSEFYFSNDKLVGWKIDPESPPMRVKLWPDGPVNPDLKTFQVGSTKNEVIVVEGTPTIFSETVFGYGASEVTFTNDRVVSWKSDSSRPLHAH